MRHHQRGFTLIEIAIVLVIIGLLLGGVLKGQELINQAKIKNVANDLNGVSVAVYAYQDRYKRLPGETIPALLAGPSAAPLLSVEMATMSSKAATHPLPIPMKAASSGLRCAWPV